MWICHSRGLNKTNHLHEQALRTVYHNINSDFKTLLENDKSFIIHVKNLHYLLTEIYKVKNDISPDIMKDIFTFHKNNNYKLKDWYPSCFKKHENDIVWDREIWPAPTTRQAKKCFVLANFCK